MTTRSAIFLQTETREWLRHYCHINGYPEHMLPALAKVDPAAIVAAQELRYINSDGTLDAFERPRAPERMTQLEWPLWAEHAYVLMDTRWRHAATPDQLEKLSGPFVPTPT